MNEPETTFELRIRLQVNEPVDEAAAAATLEHLAERALVSGPLAEWKTLGAAATVAGVTCDVERPPALVPDHYEPLVFYLDEDGHWRLDPERDADPEAPALRDRTLADLVREGVLTQVLCEYPRGEKYGTPAVATEIGALAHFSSLRPSAMFDVEPHDRGDDGAEQLWVEVAVPPALAEKVQRHAHRVGPQPSMG